MSVWVCHKLVLKNEHEWYYFSRLDSNDGDIMCSTPSENWCDVKPNEKLLEAPVPPGSTSSHA